MGEMILWHGTDEQLEPSRMKQHQHSLKAEVPITDIEIMHKNELPVNCIACDELGQIRMYDIPNFTKVL